MFRGIARRIAEVRATAPRTYWLLWWGTLVNRLGNFVVPLLTIYLIKVRHVPVSDAGGVVAVFGAGSIGASLVGGFLADRVGRKFTLVVSLFGGAIAMTALGMMRSVSSITAMVGVLGFVGELYRPAVLATVADVVPPPHRLAAYGLLHWVINIGYAFAAVVGGALAELDFTILFVADAATMAIYGVIVVVAVPETRSRAAPRAPGEAPSRSWITDGPFVVLAVLLLGLALLPALVFAPLAAHLTWQGFSPAEFGRIMAINGVMIIVAQPSISMWASRHDPTRMLMAAALIYGVGLALHGLATTMALHSAAVAVWTIGEILESPTRSSIVATMAPADARGRYQGAISMTIGTAALLGPKLGTWVWDRHGPGALWGSGVALGVTVAIALWVTGPARRRRLARGAPAAQVSAARA